MGYRRPSWEPEVMHVLNSTSPQSGVHSGILGQDLAGFKYLALSTLSPTQLIRPKPKPKRFPATHINVSGRGGSGCSTHTLSCTGCLPQSQVPQSQRQCAWRERHQSLWRGADISGEKNMAKASLIQQGAFINLATGVFCLL